GLPYARDRRAPRRGGPAPGAGEAERPRSQWPDLRDAGLGEAADRLTAEVAAGRMNDVDCARVAHAFAAARRGGPPAAGRRPHRRPPRP
ncbi:ATP/GTP-binding protein, partial [Streptomyces pilosus]